MPEPSQELIDAVRHRRNAKALYGALNCLMEGMRGFKLSGPDADAAKLVLWNLAPEYRDDDAA